jgi:hypothetical protein
MVCVIHRMAEGRNKTSESSKDAADGATTRTLPGLVISTPRTYESSKGISRLHTVRLAGWLVLDIIYIQWKVHFGTILLPSSASVKLVDSLWLISYTQQSHRSESESAPQEKYFRDPATQGPK